VAGSARSVNVLSKPLQHDRPLSEEPPPTITTVARLANVSVASASRALNGIRTRPDVHAKVLEAAEAVGYVPNAAARSLRSRRTDQILFAMPDVANPVYTAMVSTIQEVARTGGFRLLLHSTGANAEDELETIRDLKRRFVDGLILCSLEIGDEHRRELERATVPVVVISGPAASTRVDTVRADSRKGAAEAVRHLHEVGRRRIAFVNGPPNTAPGSSRRLGYLDGLRDCGLEVDDALVEIADDFMVEPGRAAAERLLARVRPDAIFCANDLVAVGTLAALRAANLDVPGDVAVVGMDDTPLAEHTWPPLTTVDLGTAERARLAADLLLKRIEQPGRRRRSLGVEPRLVVRASSGART
jgi:LacI family transcriptional regulator, galactose operon repressor